MTRQPNLEIERKFLVTGTDYRDTAESQHHMIQGFLSRDPHRVVRVRVSGQQAWLTIKGASSADATSRFEWEKAISKDEGMALLELCLPGKIEKVRYRVTYSGFCFEVDEFFGENQGLIMAEIELTHPEEPFDRPNWLGQEVTEDFRYYNAQLSQNPFSQWA
ncbi:MAG: adenylate cyclase [Cryomorphaceae bacterium BACL21 MAG-121220-bin10]|jgi:adenylate cyclase|nr:MAG: adenylate cyclase [Cryomorphaceae bacterium BACL21 MAG-121220-bin10]MDA0701060.1 CYTH domain-containing protein [Bacteroidota bacterium]MDB9783223.1 CYTH domain-containing protein [Winogradskyella sp.]|tara:strand:- start:14549 stop:15034 length:486 start_codon:yes stop_codon:yes gene_type:complete